MTIPIHHSEGGQHPRLRGSAAPEIFGKGENDPRIALLLVAGVQYLLVRSRKLRIFGGIDLSSHAGWAALKAALAGMAHQMLGGASPAARAGCGADSTTGAVDNAAGPGAVRKRRASGN